MGSFSIIHWLILLSVTLVYVIPAWKIVSKAGYPGVFCLLAFVPLVNIIMLWVFAFSTWPRDRS